MYTRLPVCILAYMHAYVFVTQKTEKILFYLHVKISAYYTYMLGRSFFICAYGVLHLRSLKGDPLVKLEKEMNKKLKELWIKGEINKDMYEINLLQHSTNVWTAKDSQTQYPTKTHCI